MMKKLFLNISFVFALSFGASSLHAAVMPVSMTASPDPLGQGWEIVCTREIFGTCLEWGVDPTVEHTVSIELSDGWTDVFDVGVNSTYAQPGGIAQGNLTFTPRIDTRGELVPLDNVLYDFLIGGELFDLNFDVIDPEYFQYTLEGTTYILPDDLVIPIPAAVWLFSSGLLGLIGIARRANA